MKLLAAGFLALLSFSAHAQIAVTLTSSAPSGISPHSHALTWSAPGATGCTASGSWTGAKAASGTQAITGLRANASYRLDCVGTAVTPPCSATLTWTPPTQNTDGSALTNLAAYDVSYGATCSELSAVKAVPAPATGTVVTGISGPTCFGVKARSATGVQSALSNTVTKACPGPTTPTGSAQVAVTVDTQPAPPTGLAVTETTAWSIQPDGSNWLSRLIARIRGDYRLDHVVGEVALGTSCSRGTDIREAGYYRVPRDAVTFTHYARGVLVAQCV